MKCLLLTYEFPPQKGGIASYLEALALNKPNGIELNVVVPKEHWVKTIFKILKRELKSKDDLIITSHVIPLGYVCLKTKFFLGVRYAVICHGTDIFSARRSFFKRALMRLVLHAADAVIANSAFTARLLAEEGIKDAQIVYPSVQQNLQPTTYNLQPTILSVGRLVPRKGFDTMIKAMPEVIKTIPDATYTIIGAGNDLDRLMQIADETNVKNKVIFINNADDETKNRLYNEASLFVLPARQEGNDVEGFGIVTIEASARGLPVIVGDSGGAAEAVRNEKTGLVIPPNDVKALVNAVIRLLADKTLAQKMGEDGKLFARTFAPQQTAEKFWSLVLTVRN